MNANDHRITWCLNWGEDAVSGWSACYCVNPGQERERRELRDGTISEAFTGTFHSGYLEDKKTGKYYTAMIDKCDPSTKLCVRLGLVKIEPRNA